MLKSWYKMNVTGKGTATAFAHDQGFGAAHTCAGAYRPDTPDALTWPIALNINIPTMKRACKGYLLCAAALLAAVHACHAAGRGSTGLRASDGNKHDITFQSSSKKVLVELFVMSRCPDAKRAETRFDEVFSATHAIATPRLVHIASINGSSVTCMHGEAECNGNVQQVRYGEQV